MAQNIVHSVLTVQSGNFRFLESHDVQLVRLGALAERYFHDDPNTCIIKLRQFAELLTQLIAAKTGLYEAGDESQADLLRRLRFERVLPPQVADLFHTLRILGNNAAHGAAGTLSEALNALKYARQAGVWFHRTFGRDPLFVAGPFRPPAAPEDAAAPVRAELERLRADLLATKSAAEQARLAAEENARARQTAEQRARQEAEERATWNSSPPSLSRKDKLSAHASMLRSASPKLDPSISKRSSSKAKPRLRRSTSTRPQRGKSSTKSFEIAAGRRMPRNSPMLPARAPPKVAPWLCRMADRKRARRLRLVCRADVCRRGRGQAQAQECFGRD